MNYILFDGPGREQLLPFTYTRPVADIRLGMTTLREKWEFFLRQKTSTLTRDYLAEKFPLKTEEKNILINASVIPDARLIEQIRQLGDGQALVKDEVMIALFVHARDVESMEDTEPEAVLCEAPVRRLQHVWEIFSMNNDLLREDFAVLTKGRKSLPLSSTNFVLGDPDLIFLEEGARVEFAFLNTTDGPIYIGKNAEVMEGAKIRGPFALCESSVVKMDAKIYGGTTIGPHCKVGGEVSNSVIFGYTNKAHDGFLGNSVLGEWCNLGADTNVSNLKNTYEPVKLWSYVTGRFENTGQQFCGLMMGDHSKTGINTMFNTGTVVGVFANIFGDGYQRNFIPSFSWGGKHGLTHYNLKKAFQVAGAVFARRHKRFDETEEKMLTRIYEITYDQRR
ncbi:MAG TPA: glucose-1-phosphate thymidylyltransferase [Bacteroidetes bacterium]|nr:glucose-1-phosphate thymidylyltransferase [Bacteroidota bacterium]